MAERSSLDGGLFDAVAYHLNIRSSMDGNLTIMLICIGLYIISLGVASVSKVNLKGLAILSILVAFWFGFQWKSFIGILAVLGGVIIGVIILKMTVGAKHNG